MKKILIIGTLVVNLIMVTSGRSEAQSVYFYLENSSSSTISEVYISPSENLTWNLYTYYVFAGDEIKVSIPDWLGSTCSFDVKVVFSSGESEVIYNLNACTLYKLTLYSDNYYYADYL